jgi:hypothetical protein
MTDKERIEELEGIIEEMTKLFGELRGDWSDNRGPCRTGLGLAEQALGTERADKAYEEGLSATY